MRDKNLAGKKECILHLLFISPALTARKCKKEKEKNYSKLLFVLRNVFPVEWGIFAFSSIIIVTKNISQNARGSRYALGTNAGGHSRIVVPPRAVAC